MKYAIFIFIVMSMAFLSLISCNKVKTTPKENYMVSVIHEDYNASLQKAQADNKNVCIMLHADWCSICKTFIADVLTDEGVAQAINGKILFALIDGDKTYGKTYYDLYKASSFPTFVITDKQGVEITKRSGKMDKTEFQNWITNYLK